MNVNYKLSLCNRIVLVGLDVFAESYTDKTHAMKYIGHKAKLCLIVYITNEFMVKSLIKVFIEKKNSIEK